MTAHPLRNILTLPLLLCALACRANAASDPSPAPASLTWSHPDLDKTLTGNIPFHGPFENETIRIKTAPLPSHDFLEVSYDLLILRTWDGSVPMAKNGRPQGLGPDFFRSALTNGPTFLYTTFSNRPAGNDFQPDSRFQNYPSQVPGSHLDPQTGADAKNTLGYNYPLPGPPQLFSMDATYHIKFILPHSALDATLELSAMNLSNFIDENWGVANVQIRALPREAVDHVDPQAIAAAFAHALDTAAVDQPASFQTLINGMDDTADWIAASVQPQPLDIAKLAESIKNLAADDTGISLREQAALDIYALGPQTEPYLRDARQSASGEVRQRIDWLLQWIGTTEISDENLRRTLLATRALEIIGTPRALHVRKRLTESN